MWRRYGDAAYGTLVLVGLILQAAALGFLAWSFVPSLSGEPGGGPFLALLGALLLAVAILLGVVGFILAYHVLSTRRREGHDRRVRGWNERWVRVLFGEPPPEGALPQAALEGLLHVRDRLRGGRADAVAQLFDRYWQLDELLRPLRSRRLVRRLDALDRLARARLTAAFFPILHETELADARTRSMAVRAAARTLPTFPTGAAKEKAGEVLARALDDERIPSGVALESLMLLEDAASWVIRLLLGEGTTRGLRWAAVEAAGRLERRDLADAIGLLLRDPDEEIRAAAFRALLRIAVLPEGASWAIMDALADPIDFVRVQAARASVLLPAPVVVPVLWALLGDRSWWVRRASAEALRGHGDEGGATLDRAAHHHPDRYARHMAIQLLFDDRHIDAATAQLLREAV